MSLRDKVWRESHLIFFVSGVLVVVPGGFWDSKGPARGVVCVDENNARVENGGTGGANAGGGRVVPAGSGGAGAGHADRGKTPARPFAV